MPKPSDQADLFAKPGHDIHLTALDPAFTADFKLKHDNAKEKLREDMEHFVALQETFEHRTRTLGHRSHRT
jgi:hypothetical protein